MYLQADSLRTPHYLCSIPAPKAKPESNNVGTSSKPRLKDDLQNNQTVLFKSMSTNTKNVQEAVPDQKRIKR